MDEKKVITAWVSRYAFTQGIISIQAEVCSDTMISEVKASYPTFYHKPDWHETKEEAVKRAEIMRVKKIAALKKQIAKLEKMTF